MDQVHRTIRLRWQLLQGCVAHAAVALADATPAPTAANPFQALLFGRESVLCYQEPDLALVATQIESLAEILELAVADNLLQPNQVILTFTHMANLLAGTCQAPFSQVDLACPDLCATPGTCSDCCSAAVSLILDSVSCQRFMRKDRVVMPPPEFCQMPSTSGNSRLCALSISYMLKVQQCAAHTLSAARCQQCSSASRACWLGARPGERTLTSGGKARTLTTKTQKPWR